MAATRHNAANNLFAFPIFSIYPVFFTTKLRIYCKIRPTAGHKFSLASSRYHTKASLVARKYARTGITIVNSLTIYTTQLAKVEIERRIAI